MARAHVEGKALDVGRSVVLSVARPPSGGVAARLFVLPLGSLRRAGRRLHPRRKSGRARILREILGRRFRGVVLAHGASVPGSVLQYTRAAACRGSACWTAVVTGLTALRGVPAVVPPMLRRKRTGDLREGSAAAAANGTAFGSGRGFGS